MVALSLAGAPLPAAAQTLEGWELAGVGWEGRLGALELDAPETPDARVAHFRWAGEGAPDLPGFDFAGACDLVAGLFAQVTEAGGAPGPARLRIVATASTSDVIRLSRTVRQDFEVTGGRCLAMGEGVEL